jgi:hypothetical protein
MPDQVVTLLRKQFTRLETERKQIDRQLSAIRNALTTLDGRPETNGMPRRRRAMSAAARRAVGKRMRAYWAKRRAAKTKATQTPKNAQTTKRAKTSK